MNRNARNQSLMAGISPQNPFRDTVAQRAFQILNSFEKDIAAIGEDRRSSAAWKQELAKQRVQKAQAELLSDVQKPIDAYHTQTESMRAGMKTPVYDKTDLYAAGLRRELRDASRAMSFGQRAALLSGPKRDPNFVDALLEAPSWLAGVNADNPNEAQLLEEARQERLRDLNGPLMDALEARASVESEIAMIANVVKNDIASDATDLASRAA